MIRPGATTWLLNLDVAIVIDCDPETHCITIGLPLRKLLNIAFSLESSSSPSKISCLARGQNGNERSSTKLQCLEPRQNLNKKCGTEKKTLGDLWLRQAQILYSWCSSTYKKWQRSTQLQWCNAGFAICWYLIVASSHTMSNVTHTTMQKVLPIHWELGLVGWMVYFLFVIK